MQGDIEKARAAGKDTTLSQRDLEAAKEKFNDEYTIASRGLYHGTTPEGGWTDQSVWEPESLDYARKREGFPEEGMGVHPAAKNWEINADTEIKTFLAENLQSEHLQGTKLLKENEWINKISPEAKVYGLDAVYPDVNLEFRHMIDEVREAMNPDTVLPKNLRIAPKDLEKMTVDDVSALSGKISAWRDVQKTKSDLQVANNPATQMFKEYPAENNPKGVSWRQIKRPEGYSEEEAEKFVREATKYEGDIMRHCVGGAGHCEPLLRGDVELYTLRDAKGEPHVTIEVEPGKWDWAYIKEDGGDPLQVTEEAKRRMGITPENESAMMRNLDGEGRFQKQKEVSNLVDKIYKEQTGKSPPSNILEIKGKNNNKPKDEYIPFVQDFVKSGNFGTIGDIKNTDLVVLTKDLESELKKAGATNIPKYVTPQEDADLLNWALGNGELPKGFAKGGAVSNTSLESRLNGMLAHHYASGGAVSLEDKMNKMLATHYANGGQVGLKNIEPQEGLAPYGLRHSGESVKGKGYFGNVPHVGGSMATEISSESPNIGEYPLMVPTLTREELEYLLAGGKPTDAIYNKAEAHALSRKKQGKGTFAHPSELRYPLPEKMAEGGSPYNSNPDMADGEAFIQAPPFKIGGHIKSIKN